MFLKKSSRVDQGPRGFMMKLGQGIGGGQCRWEREFVDRPSSDAY
jgi:hypothetical protein